MSTMYSFGFYHWRRWLRLIAKSVGIFGAAMLVWKKTTNRIVRVLTALIGGVSMWYAAKTALKMLHPPPWQLGEEIYTELAVQLPYNSADQVLDIGCGTGRSLVGLAPYIPKSCSVVGIDIFTDEIIFGNTPERARTNAHKAGQDVDVIVGDTTQLPVADGTQDIITICRVLHDLSVGDARQTLEEVRRACAPDGTIGVVELPVIHNTAADPEQYWRDIVVDSGFVVENIDKSPWKDDQDYILLTAHPSET